MKRMKKLLMIALAVVLVAGSLVMPSQTAYAAATATFSVSGGGNVTQGNTVSVTVSVNGSDIMSYAKVSVNYDANILEYQSGADSGGSGRVSVLFDCGEGAKSASRTITFKAKTVGSSAVSLDTAEATTMGSATVMPEMMSASVGGSASVTVSAPVQASADAHIGWMDISPGTLSPAFDKDVFKYTVEVENDVKKVTVSALAAHEKGKIASVKGGSNLKVGQNTITVTCQAENGNTAVYTIVVTRKEGNKTEEPEQPTTEAPEEPETPTEGLTVNMNGVDWFVSQDFKANIIPEGFEEATVNYQGTDIKGVKFSKGDLYLIYLTDAEKKNGNFYIYYTGTGTIEEMVKLSFIEGTYVIFLSPEQYQGVPTGLMETQFAIEDRNLRGWQLENAFVAEEAESLTLENVSADPSQFYFVYGMNQEGNMGWYTIDTMENTIQRFALFASEKEEEAAAEEVVSNETEPTAKNTQLEKKVEIFQLCILAMSALMVILIIVTIMLAVKGRKKSSEDEEETLDDSEEMEELENTEEVKDSETEEKEIKEEAPVAKAENGEAAEEERLKALSEKLEKLSKGEPTEETKPVEKKEKMVEEPRKEESATKVEDNDDFGLEFIDLDDM